VEATDVRPELISVTLLRLDPDNPRLPEGVQRTPLAMLQYVYDRGSLAEIGESFLDNGYFQAERLVVRPENDHYVVVEGNRRLATLMVLHEFPEAEGMRVAEDDPTAAQLDRLRKIPCLVLEPGESVDTYLAYRHIGGLKTWSPEAKARFIKRMVEREVQTGVDNVFRAVGRRVGSNALGVRNPYLALAVLEHGRDELSIPTRFVQYERFGVWIRCMNSVDLRSFIHLGDPRTYEEVRGALDGLNPDALAELISDLSPRGSRKPVLRDSRDVTEYGRVVTNERAREVLRTHDDLEVAKQVVRQESLPDRVARVATEADLLMEEVNQLEVLDEAFAHDLIREVNRLAGTARSLRAVVRELAGDD
jgi:hypothetical protein